MVTTVSVSGRVDRMSREERKKETREAEARRAYGWAKTDEQLLSILSSATNVVLWEDAHAEWRERTGTNWREEG